MREPQQKVTELQFTVQKRAIIYARVSTDEQAEKGTSIEAQIEKSKAYAQSQNMTIIGIFADDYTGTTLDRPELNKVRVMFKEGQADALICFKTDRLDRSEWGTNLLYLAQELKMLGVELYYSETGRKIDLFNPQEMLLESIKGWQAGEERSIIVKRLADGRRNRAKQGGVIVHGIPPYGYRQVKKEKMFQLEINEAEADIVRQIYNWYVFGDKEKPKFTLNDIVRRLTEMRIPSPGDTRKTKKKRNKGVWGRSTVARILGSTVYKGTWYYGKKKRKNGKLIRNENEQELIPVSVPAIIAPGVWDLAQARLKENKENAKRNLKYEYLMSKRLNCGCCGYKVAGEPSYNNKKTEQPVKRLYYRCPSDRIDSTRNCDLPVFRVDQVDTAIWNWVKGLFEDEKRLEDAIKRYLERTENEITPLRENIRGLDKLIKEQNRELVQSQRDYKAFEGSNAERTKTSIKLDIERIEATLDVLEKRRQAIIVDLERSMISDKDLQAIRDYACEVRKGLDIASTCFDERCWLIEKLDVRATLAVEDGQKIAYVECRLGEKPERVEVCVLHPKEYRTQFVYVVLTARLVIG